MGGGEVKSADGGQQRCGAAESDRAEREAARDRRACVCCVFRLLLVIAAPKLPYSLEHRKQHAKPQRTDARFAVGGVPTLIHWTAAGAPGAKLGPELEAAASPAEAVALVAKFVAETRGA